MIEVKPTLIGDTYQIETLENLRWFMLNSDSWGSKFLLTNNIDASATEYWDDDNLDNEGTDGENQGWLSVGNSEIPFTGEFDGGGFYIQYLRMSRDETNSPSWLESLSFFGIIEDAVIRDLRLSDLKFLYSGDSIGDSELGQLPLIGTVKGESNLISNFRFSGLTWSGTSKYGGYEDIENYVTDWLDARVTALEKNGLSSAQQAKFDSMERELIQARLDLEELKIQVQGLQDLFEGNNRRLGLVDVEIQRLGGDSFVDKL